MKKLLITILIMICSVSLLFAQRKLELLDRTTEKPISGATIKLLPGGNYVMSSDNGLAIISKDVESVTISHMSYKTRKIFFNDFDEDVIYLEPFQQELEEVIIQTGYDEIPRERATGSFEFLNEEQLSKIPSTDIFGKLEGLSTVLFDRTGYLINGNNHSHNMLIRGPSTLFSDSRPLIILDNFPFEGDLFSINPNEVESITVLKDAAAASIWGARAGNGVIVVTTKKGSTSSKATLEYNSSLSIEDKPYLKNAHTLSSSDFIEIEKFLYSKGFYNGQINSSQHPSLSPVVELLLQEKENFISQSHLQEELNKLTLLDVRDDYLKYIYRNPIYQQHSVGLSMGSDLHSTRIGVGYDKNLYNLKTNLFERQTVNLFNSLHLGTFLTVNARLLYASSKENNIATGSTFGYGSTFISNKMIFPYARLAAEDGTPISMDKDYRRSYLESLENVGLLDWNYQILDDMGTSVSKQKNEDITLSFNPVFSVGKGFKVQFNYQYQRISRNTDDLYNEDSYYARNLVNLYSQVIDGHVQRNIPHGGILVRKLQSGKVHSLRGQANYKRVFGENHRLDALGGMEVRRRRNEFDQNRRYGYSTANEVYSEVNFSQSYPMFDGLSYAKTIPNNRGLGWTEDRFISLFANLSYSFDDKHILTFSARKDASNIFGTNTNQKWSPLWSMGYMWNIIKDQYSTLDFFSYLKLRATYGFSGNIDPNRLGIVAMNYSSQNDSYSNLPYATISNASNVNLRWERVGTFNLGLDFASQNKIVSGGIDVYRKSAKDLFGYFPLDPTSGFLNLYSNNANTRTNGMDLNIMVNYKRSYFSGNSNLKIGIAKTKVQELHMPPLSSSLALIAFDFQEDKTYRPMLSFQYNGLSPETGAPLGYLDGKVDDNYLAIVRNTPIEDMINHGSSIPIVYSNFSHTFNYKNMSLFFNVLGQFNYYFRKVSIDYARLFQQNSGHADFEKRWVSSGDELRTDVPSLYYPVNTNRENFYKNSAALVRRGDHIRLQDVRLEYRTTHLEDKLNVKRVQFFITGSNLGLLWTKNTEGIDPVYSNTGIAPSRAYTLGINIQL